MLLNALYSYLTFGDGGCLLDSHSIAWLFEPRFLASSNVASSNVRARVNHVPCSIVMCAISITTTTSPTTLPCS